MNLSFPNPARSYDPVKQQVQFWGYARAIELTFYLNDSALRKLHPDMSNDRDGVLAAFDASLSSIQKVANEVYARGGATQYAYNLPANAF